MTTLYCSRWVLPVISPAIEDGAVAVSGSSVVGVGPRAALLEKFPGAPSREFKDAAIIPGLVNAHSHLELTAMRGFLEREERSFDAWLKKLTAARLEKMTGEDIYFSALLGAVEAARAGVTCLADASDSAHASMRALNDAGLRGIVYQETFGPDPRAAGESFQKLREKVAVLRGYESELVRAGVSPHAPFTASAALLELVSEFALAEGLPLMMHAAESEAEALFMREGRGPFAENYTRRGIEWQAPGVSTIQYLARHGVMDTRPLLAHCVRVDERDVETMRDAGAGVAHCPKSNAKLGHGHAPFSAFLKTGLRVGIGSDSVASNNLCDLLEEARSAALFARAFDASPNTVGRLGARKVLRAATLGGAQALWMDNKVGALAEGFQADLAVVSLGGAHQRPVYDPADALVFASSGRDVLLTMVAGKEVYSGGRVLTVDEEDLRARVEEIGRKLRS